MGILRKSGDLVQGWVFHSIWRPLNHPDCVNRNKWIFFGLWLAEIEPQELFVYHTLILPPGSFSAVEPQFRSTKPSTIDEHGNVHTLPLNPKL